MYGPSVGRYRMSCPPSNNTTQSRPKRLVIPAHMAPLDALDALVAKLVETRTLRRVEVIARFPHKWGCYRFLFDDLVPDTAAAHAVPRRGGIPYNALSRRRGRRWSPVLVSGKRRGTHVGARRGHEAGEEALRGRFGRGLMLTCAAICNSAQISETLFSSLSPIAPRRSSCQWKGLR